MAFRREKIQEQGREIKGEGGDDDRQHQQKFLVGKASRESEYASVASCCIDVHSEEKEMDIQFGAELTQRYL